MNNENLSGAGEPNPVASQWEKMAAEITSSGPESAESREQRIYDSIENLPADNAEILHGLEDFCDGMIEEERGTATDHEALMQAEQTNLVMTTAIESAKMVTETSGISASAALKRLKDAYDKKSAMAKTGEEAKTFTESATAVKRLVFEVGNIVARKNTNGMKPDVELR